MTENCILENENARSLSFSLSDSENGTTNDLPPVTAKWEIVSGSAYVSLSGKDENEVQITNTNYSNSVQTVSLKLIITPENKTYEVATVIINLKTAVLVKKDITMVIFYDGENVSEKPMLKSASDVLLSYSAGSDTENKVAVTAKWEFETGSNYVLSADNNDSLNIFNVNTSGENKEITVKLTLTPKSVSYNPSSASITFIAQDSTEDLQPGKFSASAALNRTYDYIGSEDGTVKISWLESKNANAYYVYRNEKQIACVTDKLYYIDDFSSDISDISSNNYNVTYYVKAENQGLSTESAPVDFYVGGLIPSSKASNIYAIPLQDSDRYYGIHITWESKDYATFEVYRLVSSSNSVFADEIIKNGKRCFRTYGDNDYKYNNSKSLFEWSCWDYEFLDEISRGTPYVHYALVTIKTYRSPNNYVEFSSEPSKTYYANCLYLVGKPTKPLDAPVTPSKPSSGSSSSSSSSSTITTIEVHCIPCSGSGKCPRCNGKGYYYETALGKQKKYICTRCTNGKCPYCHGTGRK